MVLGTLASTASIAAYAASQVVTKSLIDGETPPQVGSVITLVTGTVFLFFFAAPTLRRDLKAPKKSLMWVSLAGLLASNGAFLSFFALHRAPVVVISPIVAISPLMTLVLAAIFLRQSERITRRTVFGSLIVVAGVLLVVLGNAA